VKFVGGRGKGRWLITNQSFFTFSDPGFEMVFIQPRNDDKFEEKTAEKISPLPSLPC
jgi:hypothetical protein